MSVSALPDEPGVWCIAVAGELDVDSVTGVRERFADVLRGDPRRIVVDLSALRFMDSTGIALLLETAAQVPDLVIERPPPIVATVIEAMGLSSVLRVEP